MKTWIIFNLSWIFLCLPLSGRETDTVKVSGIFYLDEEPVSVVIADGKITRIDRLPENSDHPPVYVAPGLIDLQVNGYSGVDFSDQQLTLDDIRRAT